MSVAPGDRAAQAAALNLSFPSLDPAARLSALRAASPGRIVFTSSFGLEDQALTHLIAQSGLDIEFVTLDTGRLFPDAYDVWASTEQRYGVKIKAFYPRRVALEDWVSEHGINGFRDSSANRHACCGLRKIEPLARALAGADVWITGLRADQSQNRAGMDYVSFDAARGLIKANPLLDWSRQRAVNFAGSNDVPINALHAQGFLSIGCAPCTRAIAPGEDERAGRWWWEQSAQPNDKECGLHVDADGKLARASGDQAVL
jgi:phosphoadenosine phosphosulfate reductase